MWLLCFMALLWQGPVVDLSSSVFLDGGSVRILCVARMPGYLLVGKETSCGIAPIDTMIFEHAGMEEHQVTALLERDGQIWAGAFSIYNPQTPLLYSSTLEALPQWESRAVLPEGALAIRRLTALESGLALETQARLFLFSLDHGLEDVTPQVGLTFVAAVFDQGRFFALMEDDLGSGHLFQCIEPPHWDPLYLDVALPNPTWFTRDADGLLIGLSSGLIFRMQGEQLTKVLDMGVDDLVRFESSGTGILFAHDFGRMAYQDATGSVVWLYAEAETNQQATRVFALEDRLYYACQPNAPFLPVHCSGLFAFDPLGKMDRNGDEQVDALDILTWLESWGEGGDDLNGDGRLDAVDLAAVMSLVRGLAP